MIKAEECSGFDILNRAIHIGTAEEAWQRGVRHQSTLPMTLPSGVSSSAMQSSNSFQFPWKLHDMLEHAEKDGMQDIVAWTGEGSSYGTSFKVFKPTIFVEKLMPQYFKQTKYKSFQRQLNLYGYTRINEGPGKGGYKHKYFIKGNKALCQYISRQSTEEQVGSANSSGITPSVSGGNYQTTFSPSPTPIASIAPQIGALHEMSNPNTVSPESSVAQFISSPEAPTPMKIENDISDQYNALIQRDYQFPWKLHDMLEHAATHNYDHIVSWVPPGDYCFKVHESQQFVDLVMPRFFKQTKYKSFQRQLNLYGFTRVEQGPSKGSYRHKLFQRGRKDLLSSMNRQRHSQSESLTKASSSQALHESASHESELATGTSMKSESKCIDRGIPKALALMDDGNSSIVSEVSVPKSEGANWRDPPSESDSDWTVVVLHNDTFDRESYHVHKRQLGSGDRRSAYFAAIFERSAPTISNENVLVLGTAEIAVFSDLLDFVYFDFKPHLNIRKAYSLFMLSKELEIPALRKLTLEFFHQNLRLDNILQFIQVASEFKDENLTASAIDCCAKALPFIEISDAAKLPPPLLPKLVDACKTLSEVQQADLSMSALIAESLYSHRQSLTVDHFLASTVENVLPTLDSFAAIKLLATESCLRRNIEDEFGTDSPLRNRCVSAIVANWLNVRQELQSSPRLAGAFKSISSDVMYHILMMTTRSLQL